MRMIALEKAGITAIHVYSQGVFIVHLFAQARPLKAQTATNYAMNPILLCLNYNKLCLRL